jgi:sigma-B regulation protein RsbU (phosphoserine phosphatase)
MGQQLLDRTNELNGFIVGENSLPNQRARELGLLATASQLLAENTELSRELTEIVDQLVSDAKQDIADANSEALSVQKFSTVVLVAVGALSLASSILIVWLYVGRNLITRLTTLSDSMLAIAGGNLEAKIPSGGNDEITDMAKALSVFLDTTKSRDEFRGAKERMEGELNAAKEIQMSMLPLTFPPFPQRSEFSVFATLAPAREVGGDFYDFFFIDEDRFCFCIGDVSGKGVPAALFMAVSKSLIKSRATADFSSASIITHVNNELGRDNDACMFVTVFLGILDVKTGALTYTNAGHNPPYLLQSDGGVIQLNQCHGLVVAAMEGTVYGEDKITVIPGDLLLTYTDGVTEAMDVNEALYSDERLTSLLSSRQFESTEEIVDVTVSDVWDFQGDAEQADDVTVLAIQYFGEPKGKAL